MSERESEQSFKLSLTPEIFGNILANRVSDISYIPFSVQGLLYNVRELNDLGKPKYRIFIKWGDTAREQQKTLIHEVVHIHWELFDHGEERITLADHELIEEETERFYKEHTNLVRSYHRRFRDRARRRNSF